MNAKLWIACVAFSLGMAIAWIGTGTYVVICLRQHEPIRALVVGGLLLLDVPRMAYNFVAEKRRRFALPENY